MRVLLRTLAGLEDFARVTAHHTRRDIHPELARDDLKRMCLYCLVHQGCRVLDSEWHSFFCCPCVAAARTRFQFYTGIELATSDPCTAENLGRLVRDVSLDRRMAGALSSMSVVVISLFCFRAVTVVKGSRDLLRTHIISSR